MHHKIVELVLSLAISGHPAAHTPPKQPVAGHKSTSITLIAPLKAPELAEQETLAPIEPPPPVILYPGNFYAPGNCTWYAKSRRPDLPNDLGNANTWAYTAAAYGFATGYIPRAGAIGATQLGSLGHVVYVESVNPDGTFNLTEMNYEGLYIISGRQSVSPAGFTFIY